MNLRISAAVKIATIPVKQMLTSKWTEFIIIVPVQPDLDTSSHLVSARKQR